MNNSEIAKSEYKPEKEITEDDVFEMIKGREVFVDLNNILLDLDRINPGGDKIHAFFY